MATTSPPLEDDKRLLEIANRLFNEISDQIGRSYQEAKESGTKLIINLGIQGIQPESFYATLCAIRAVGSLDGAVILPFSFSEYLASMSVIADKEEYGPKEFILNRCQRERVKHISGYSINPIKADIISPMTTLKEYARTLANLDAHSDTQSANLSENIDIMLSAADVVLVITPSIHMLAVEKKAEAQRVNSLCLHAVSESEVEFFHPSKEFETGAAPHLDTATDAELLLPEGRAVASGAGGAGEASPPSFISKSAVRRLSSIGATSSRAIVDKIIRLEGQISAIVERDEAAERAASLLGEDGASSTRPETVESRLEGSGDRNEETAEEGAAEEEVFSKRRVAEYWKGAARYIHKKSYKLSGDVCHLSAEGAFTALPQDRVYFSLDKLVNQVSTVGSDKPLTRYALLPCEPVFGGVDEEVASLKDAAAGASAEALRRSCSHLVYLAGKRTLQSLHIHIDYLSSISDADYSSLLEIISESILSEVSFEINDKMTLIAEETTLRLSRLIDAILSRAEPPSLHLTGDMSLLPKPLHTLFDSNLADMFFDFERLLQDLLKSKVTQKNPALGLYPLDIISALTLDMLPSRELVPLREEASARVISEIERYAVELYVTQPRKSVSARKREIVNTIASTSLALTLAEEMVERIEFPSISTLARFRAEAIAEKARESILEPGSSVFRGSLASEAAASAEVSSSVEAASADDEESKKPAASRPPMRTG